MVGGGVEEVEKATTYEKAHETHVRDQRALRIQM